MTLGLSASEREAAVSPSHRSEPATPGTWVAIASEGVFYG